MPLSVGAVSTKSDRVLVKMESEDDKGSVVRLSSPGKRTEVVLMMGVSGEVDVDVRRDGRSRLKGNLCLPELRG